MGPPQAPIRTVLFLLAGLFLVAGLVWPLLSRTFGRLPGDIVVRRGGTTFFFPIVTCVLISLLLSLLLWLFRR